MSWSSSRRSRVHPLLVTQIWIVFFALLTPATINAQPDGEVYQYLTREEALLDVFPKSSTYVTEVLEFSEDDVARAEQALYRKLDMSALEVILCYDDAGVFLGYAVISEEIGKYRPITFIVGIDKELKVKEVAVMVYREDRGGEVRMPRFLYQYRGKSVDDPIRTKRDIINISGATISVRSINAGVKKVLYFVTDRYASDPPTAARSAPLNDQQAEQ